MAQLDAALAKIDANLDAALQRLFALVSIPSISTDPAYARSLPNGGGMAEGRIARPRL